MYTVPCKKIKHPRTNPPKRPFILGRRWINVFVICRWFADEAVTRDVPATARGGKRKRFSQSLPNWSCWPKSVWTVCAYLLFFPTLIVLPWEKIAHRLQCVPLLLPKWWVRSLWPIAACGSKLLSAEREQHHPFFTFGATEGGMYMCVNISCGLLYIWLIFLM